MNGNGCRAKAAAHPRTPDLAPNYEHLPLPLPRPWTARCPRATPTTKPAACGPAATPRWYVKAGLFGSICMSRSVLPLSAGCPCLLVSLPRWSLKSAATAIAPSAMPPPAHPTCSIARHLLRLLLTPNTPSLVLLQVSLEFCSFPPASVITASCLSTSHPTLSATAGLPGVLLLPAQLPPPQGARGPAVLHPAGAAVR